MNATQLLRHLKGYLDGRRVHIVLGTTKKDIVAFSFCSGDYQDIDITIDRQWAALVPAVIHELLHVYLQERGIRKILDKRLEESIVARLEKQLVNKLSEPAQFKFIQDLETSIQRCLKEEIVAAHPPVKPKKPRKPKR